MLALDVIPIGRMMADPSFALSIGRSFTGRWRRTMLNLILFGILIAIIVAAIIAWPVKKKGIEIDFESMKEGEE